MDHPEHTAPAARDGIEAANAQAMALTAAGDVDGIMELYTEDAALLPPGREPAEGLDAIRTFWRGMFDALGSITLTLDTDEVDHEGDTAIEIGRYAIRAGDGTDVDHGKFVIVWKEVDGDWLIHRDIWNTSRSE